MSVKGGMYSDEFEFIGRERFSRTGHAPIRLCASSWWPSSLSSCLVLK